MAVTVLRMGVLEETTPDEVETGLGVAVADRDRWGRGTVKLSTMTVTEGAGPEPSEP